MLPASLDKVTKEKTELGDKIKLIGSRYTQIIERFLSVSGGDLLSFHQSSSCQTPTHVLIIGLADVTRQMSDQPGRELAVAVRVLVGKRKAPITWGRDMWEDPTNAEDTNPHIWMSLFCLRKESLHP